MNKPKESSAPLRSSPSGGQTQGGRSPETRIAGFVTSEPDCEHERALNARYDAYYCPKCLIWLEPKCGNKDCGSCANRPPKAPKSAN